MLNNCVSLSEVKTIPLCMQEELDEIYYCSSLLEEQSLGLSIQHPDSTSILGQETAIIKLAIIGWQ